jgi:uncharacterized protein (TIGR00251 family)
MSSRGTTETGTPPSARLRLRVSPGAARPGIVGRHGAGWKVRVTAAPEAGKANEAVERLVAATLSVPRRDVEIVSGHSTRDKVVAVVGIDLDETERRFAAVVGKDVS